MPLSLRKVRKNRWLFTEGLEWLDAGGVPADPIGDLQTQQNKLSMWRIDDDESNLDDVLAALAASGDHIANIDYALVDIDRLNTAEVEWEKSDGNSPNDTANKEWHIDLIQLSGSSLLRIAREILSHGEFRRLTAKKVKGLIASGVRDGRIRRDQLRPGLAAKVDEVL